jgi:8-oxo-dGTP diphosphatase
MVIAEFDNDSTFNPDDFLRNVSVDNVIFGYHDKELRVLLQLPLTFDKWTLTGGYIKRTETIEEAAHRIAYSRTGINNLFLQQFRSFGTPTRISYNQFDLEKVNKLIGAEATANAWMFDYFVSVGFYTLTEFSLVDVKKGGYDEVCKWWPINELPSLIFDHPHIIDEALRALRMHISFFPIGYELLPEKFTLPEIHSLYETILGKSLDYRNFQKRLIATGILIKLNETRSIGAHRSPFLYKFDVAKYEEGLKSGGALAF